MQQSAANHVKVDGLEEQEEAGGK
ncbi:hypothetical protein C370_04052 [Cryptococcus neoformans A1-35-8]|nr:hypothetical protein C370_04052 [Cryptococcus neoformans var. grubii A1-35-8]